MDDVAVTNDENVDGIIHSDENINSCVLIDDAALIVDTEMFCVTVKLSPVIEPPVRVVKLIFDVFTVLTVKSELTDIVLVLIVVPLRVWNVILTEFNVSTFNLPVLKSFVLILSDNI
jgi:hypothetical protein